jgi:hypothetical protein
MVKYDIYSPVYEAIKTTIWDNYSWSNIDKLIISDDVRGLDNLITDIAIKVKEKLSTHYLADDIVEMTSMISLCNSVRSYIFSRFIENNVNSINKEIIDASRKLGALSEEESVSNVYDKAFDVNKFYSVYEKLLESEKKFENVREDELCDLFKKKTKCSQDQASYLARELIKYPAIYNTLIDALYKGKLKDIGLLQALYVVVPFAHDSETHDIVCIDVVVYSKGYHREVYMFGKTTMLHFK